MAYLRQCQVFLCLLDVHIFCLHSQVEPSVTFLEQSDTTISPMMGLPRNGMEVVEGVVRNGSGGRVNIVRAAAAPLQLGPRLYQNRLQRASRAPCEQATQSTSAQELLLPLGAAYTSSGLTRTEHPHPKNKKYFFPSVGPRIAPR